jgi:hypothetical protein
MLFPFVLAALLLGPAPVDAGSVAPPTPTAILAQAKAAAGGDAIARLRSVRLRERVVVLGISGKGDEWDDLVGGRFVTSQAVGPIANASGFDGKIVWAQDATGLAHATASRADMGAAITQAYATSLGYWFPQRRAATVAYAGTKSIGGKRFFVLRATPKGGFPLELWFDPTTFLLAREVVTFAPTLSAESDFSDYRSVAGVALPFSTQTQDSHGNAFSTTVLSADPNADVTGRFAMPRGLPHDFAFAHGAANATIPFALINNHIYLDARVDGKGPYRFVFDTGGQGVLNPDVAAALGIRPSGSMQGGGAGAGTVQTGFAWVPKVELGDAVLTHQSFAVLPLGGVMHAIEGVHIDGMVGYETAARYLVTIDYARRLMTLSLPRAGVKPAGIAVPFVFYQTIPMIAMDVDGITGTGIIDTGNRDALVLTTPFVDGHGLRASYAPKVAGITGYGIGGPSRAQLTRAKSLRIGPIDIADVLTALSTDTQGAMSDPTIAGNIGGGVLKRFTVTFDYVHQVMYLAKNADFARIDEGDRSGLVLIDGRAGMTAIGVLSATPAARAGLKSGDRILAVNGAPAERLGLIMVRQLLSAPAGTQVHLSVMTGTRVRDVTLTLFSYV